MCSTEVGLVGLPTTTRSASCRNVRAVQAEGRLEHDVVHRHPGRGQRHGRLGERRRDDRCPRRTQVG